MTDRFETLLGRLVDGSLPEPEAPLLGDRWDSDPALFRRAVRNWTVDRLLEATAPASEESAEALAFSIQLALSDEEKEAEDLARGVTSRLGAQGRRGRRWLWRGAAAAAAVLLGLAILRKEKSSPSPPSTPAVARSPEVPLPPEPVRRAPAAPGEEPPRPELLRPSPVPPPFSPPESPATAKPAPSAPLPPIPPGPPPQAQDATAAAPALATVERIRGEVYLLDGHERIPVRPGGGILPGRGLATAGRGSSARVSFPDGSTIDLAPGTTLGGIAEKSTREIDLLAGRIVADVVPPSSGRPVVFVTREAEAGVLGAHLALTAKPGATELEVESGRVRINRREGSESAEVPPGSRARAAGGTKLTISRMSENSRPISLAQVQTWMIQTQNLEDSESVRGLAGSAYDLLVVEPLSTFSETRAFDLRRMVSELHRGRRGRVVLAPVNLGEADSDRVYWQKAWRPAREGRKGEPDFLLGSDDWEGGSRVAFWDRRWQEIVLSTVREVLGAGFDGVLLEGIDAFEDERIRDEAGRRGVNAARAMTDLVAAVRREARMVLPGALIAGRGAPGLLEADPRYASAVDAAVFEGTWFRGSSDSAWDESAGGDEPNRAKDEAGTEELLRLYARFLRAGKPVFTLDYCLKGPNAAAVYAASRTRGLVPLVTRASQERLTETPPPWLRPSGKEK